MVGQRIFSLVCACVCALCVKGAVSNYYSPGDNSFQYVCASATEFLCVCVCVCVCVRVCVCVCVCVCVTAIITVLCAASYS
jgi:hypothetical protein